MHYKSKSIGKRGCHVGNIMYDAFGLIIARVLIFKIIVYLLFFHILVGFFYFTNLLNNFV